MRTYAGSCRVERGRSWLARVLAIAARLPAGSPAASLRVTIAPDARGETWTRDFPRHRMRSRLCERAGRLHERLGLATFVFAVRAEGDAIVWDLERVASLGVPLPLSWFRGVSARESVREGRYAFEVSAALPLAGLLVRYDGTLDATLP